MQCRMKKAGRKQVTKQVHGSTVRKKLLEGFVDAQKVIKAAPVGRGGWKLQLGMCPNGRELALRIPMLPISDLSPR